MCFILPFKFSLSESKLEFGTYGVFKRVVSDKVGTSSSCRCKYSHVYLTILYVQHTWTSYNLQGNAMVHSLSSQTVNCFRNIVKHCKQNKKNEIILQNGLINLEMKNVPS